MRPATRWHLGLLALALVVGWDIHRQFESYDQGPASSDFPTPPPAAPLADTLTLPPRAILPAFAAYQEVLERPLFERGRRFAPVEKISLASSPAPPPAVAAPPFKLAGVVLTRDLQAALVYLTRERRWELLLLGGGLQGWTLETLVPDRAVVTRAQQRYELLLEPERIPGRFLQRRSAGRAAAPATALAEPAPD